MARLWSIAAGIVALLLAAPASAGPWVPSRGHIATQTAFEVQQGGGASKRLSTLQADRTAAHVVWTAEAVMEQDNDADSDSERLDVRAGVGVARHTATGIRWRADVLLGAGTYQRDHIDDGFSDTGWQPQIAGRFSMGRVREDTPDTLHRLWAMDAQVIQRSGGAGADIKLDLTTGLKGDRWAVYPQLLSSYGPDADWGRSVAKLTVARRVGAQMTLAIGVGHSIMNHNLPPAVVVSVAVWRWP